MMWPYDTLPWHRYGLPSDFVTFSPNVTDEPWSVCMASRDKDWEPVKLWKECDTRWERRKITEQFPATASRYYDRLVRAVLKYLFGVDPDRTVEPTKTEDGKGIAGFTRALHGVTEAQGTAYFVISSSGPNFELTCCFSCS